MTRHFLTVDDLSPAELVALLDVADQLKADRRWRDDLAGASVGLLFEKPSTRTRVSFDVGVRELGGHPITLTAADLQLGRGETVEDTGRVLSEYLSALVVRTTAQDRLVRLASSATMPIVNALSDTHHPCQALADLQTIRESKGRLEGVKVTYLGDGNNVARSLAQAGAATGMRVTVASPSGYALERSEAQRVPSRDGGAGAVLIEDPFEAVKEADVLYTDVWTSMGQEAQREQRLAALAPYQLGPELLAAAAPDAIVLHCLPAHRGEEITADVIDGPQSRVWQQAGNRLHTQKALLLHLLGS